jgi:hypothetical protein
MTEAEWLQCQDPQRMVEFLCGRASGRKLRLFAVACYRLAWDKGDGHGGGREEVAVAERFADGEATGEELGEAGAVADWGPWHPWAYAAACACGPDAYQGAWYAAQDAALAGWDDREPWGGVAALGRHAGLLRELFNPFRPGALAPRWRTDAVARLAAVAYDERAFDRLPVLADALEEAGCTDAQLLAHLRGPGPHVRGCFALDEVLGRK